MDDAVRHALATDQTIDITMTGRKSGRPRRIEIWFHRAGGHFYLSGTPGRRDWYANLVANPDFVFHLKHSATADLPAHARPVTNEAERRAVMAQIIERLGRGDDLDAWVAGSPLIEVEFTPSTS
jgi:deazaflavin-dependent oxidoreductase (nitroreductase family)